MQVQLCPRKLHMGARAHAGPSRLFPSPTYWSDPPFLWLLTARRYYVTTNRPGFVDSF